MGSEQPQQNIYPHEILLFSSVELLYEDEFRNIHMSNENADEDYLI